MPNGLTSGPRIFTKLMKPVLAFLRKLEIILAIYIDDIINIHRSLKACGENTQTIIQTLKRLGFIINTGKSIKTPSKMMEFLGFEINSEQMTIKLTMDKKKVILEMCENILSLQSVKIRTVAKLIGKFTSSFVGVMYGPLHYRYLEHDKVTALKFNKGNFNKTMSISEKGKIDIIWWKENILGSYNHIGIGNPSPNMILTTDASNSGWGGTVLGQATHGFWSSDEKQLHINVLELKAICFSLVSLIPQLSDIHLMVMCDNTTAVHTITNMGTCRSLGCHDVVMEIWQWAIDNRNWITATHIPGVENCEADSLSRSQEISCEWMLNVDIFNSILTHFDIIPDIDLFASRLNRQIDTFVSYVPDPEAMHVNAFTLDWSQYVFYCFPPFACIGRIIRKIINDKARGILITPDWPTQYWYPLLLDISDVLPFILFSG